MIFWNMLLVGKYCVLFGKESISFYLLDNAFVNSLCKWTWCLLFWKHLCIPSQICEKYLMFLRQLSSFQFWQWKQVQALSTTWWSMEVLRQLCKLTLEEPGFHAALCGHPFQLFHGWFLSLATLAYAEKMVWFWTLLGPILCVWITLLSEQRLATSK